MGPVLQEILKTGFADGISVPLRSQITIGEGEFLQSIIKEIQPHVCLEVGLAFGISEPDTSSAWPSMLVR